HPPAPESRAAVRRRARGESVSGPAGGGALLVVGDPDVLRVATAPDAALPRRYGQPAPPGRQRPPLRDPATIRPAALRIGACEAMLSALLTADRSFPERAARRATTVVRGVRGGAAPRTNERRSSPSEVL